MNFRKLLVLSIVLVSSCSVEDGINGQDGVDGQDGFSIGLVSTTPEEGCRELFNNNF